MAPPLSSRLRKLGRTNVQRHESTGRGLFASSRHAKPTKITYGKQHTKPLVLDGKQFRASAYDLPSDDEDDAGAEQYLMAGGLGDRDANDDQPPATSSSDAEPDAIEILRSAFLNSGGRAWTSKQRADTTPCAAVADSTVRRKMVPDSAKPTRGNAANKQTTSKHAGPVKQAQFSPTKRRKATPTRRLPVNELFLVASPPGHIKFNAVSSYQEITAQDPIDHSSSSPLKRAGSPTEADDEASPRKVTKTPLTDIRKRIRATRWRYKSINKAQKAIDGSPKVLQTNRKEPRGRDGFENSEFAIRDRPKFVRKPRASQTPLIRKFDALQLESGPLPDVEFETPVKCELRTQLSVGFEVLANDPNNDIDGQDDFEANSQQRHPRVSFENRRLEKQIRAELSSISAPPRPRSEPDDEDEDDDCASDGVDDGEQAGAGDDDNIQTSLFGMDAREVDTDDTDAEDMADDRRISVEVAPDFVAQPSKTQDEPAERPKNPGVTLDFRRPEMMGQTSISRSLQRRKLMEVDDSIVEVPDTIPARQYTIQRHNEGQASTMHERQPRRVRSILKNSSVVPDSTPAPEHTEANTRRNSMIGIEVEESRYFTNAADAKFDPARHIVVPRRRSAYLDHQVEVLDSDHVVPETSQSQFDYTNDAQLNVLRRTSDAVWTSAADVGAEDKASRELTALTRSVSREHGTLSQSVRRRPSLPFRSPTKIN